MATLHAIHGYICSGKTTFAKQLEKDKNALRFTYDEWQYSLFRNEDSKIIGFKYGHRIKNLMYNVYSRALNLGVDVILDDGFWQIVERTNIRKYANSIGAEFHLYNVTCGFDEMLHRLKIRNESNSDVSSVIPEKDFINNQCYFEKLLGGEDNIEINTGS